jgi:alkylhydroperoxidase/carboxymuconolactone decarboxylase family protein YurZ
MDNVPNPLAARLERAFGRQPWIGDLLHTHPRAAEGLSRLVDVATGEGALGSGVKLLYMAAIAAARGDANLTAILLRGAFDAGISRQKAHGAAAALMVSRGASALATLVAAIHEVAGAPQDAAAIATAVPAASEQEVLDYVRSTYGTIPPRIQLMADELPGALEGFYLVRSGALRGGGLSAKETELLLVALNSALLEPEFVDSHARDARDEGASETELAEAVATAIPLGGMAAWHAGATGIETSRAAGSRRTAE